MMRLLLAALFVFGGMMLVVGLLGARMEHLPVILLAPALAALFLVLCVVAWVLFNSASGKPNSSADYAQRLREWEEQGLITTTDFHATRAFEVEEFEDEGQHFFLELHDGSVLYLNGQYLYDVSCHEDSQEQTPLFPCTEFTIKRHRQEGWVVDLLCRGQPLDYETLPSTFWHSPYWNDEFPIDGEILTGRTYDQLKNAG